MELNILKLAMQFDRPINFRIDWVRGSLFEFDYFTLSSAILGTKRVETKVISYNPTES